MIESTAEARDVLESVRITLERAANQEIELETPDLWLMVAALMDVEDAFAKIA